MGETTVGVFIDFKKAFDTVDHDILVNDLQHYGIRGLANKRLCSYLDKRKQYVCINGINSECSYVKCGVPQGSILGPALFILYIDDMSNVSKSMKAIVFADDTNLFCAGKDPTDVCDKGSRELIKLSKWFQVNKLSLNVSKTNLMIFGNKKYDDIHRVIIADMDIARVYATKFLGVYIDSRLNWNEHILVTRKKLAKNVSVMNRVKHLLTNDALFSLYCSLILPHLNYCYETWGNTYKSRLHPLYVLQKPAMRICNHADYKAHTKPIFQQFNMLNLYDFI